MSSTVEDLAHLREAIKDTVEALGYRAVLSEHNGIGYLPPLTAVDSCFEALRDCQVAVLIIGKRYGHVLDSKTHLSVTHAEFRRARALNIPVFCLVDREVLIFKKVFDHGNGDIPSGFPDMADATRVFALIDDVSTQQENNALLPYRGAAEACEVFRQQLAHYVGRLLRTTTDPVRTELKDVLGQIIALRGDVERALPASTEPEPYVRAATILVSDSYKQLRSIMTVVSGGVEKAVRDLLKWPTFAEYLHARGATVTVDESPIAITAGPGAEAGIGRTASWFLTSEDFLAGTSPSNQELGQQYEAHFLVYRDRRVVLNSAARRYFEIVYASARAMAFDR